MIPNMTQKEKHRWIVKQTALFLSKLDGCFVECGVKQGTSSRIMAQVLKCKGFLFDTWRGFPHYSEHDVLNIRRQHRLDKRVHQFERTYKACKLNLINGKVMKYCSMIKGDILRTVPKFIIENHNINVIMLHIDADLHDPTKTALECFFPFVDSKGVILIHDYGDNKWPGVKKVVDTFVNQNNCFFVDHKTTIGVEIATLSKIDLFAYSKYILQQWKQIS